MWPKRLVLMIDSVGNKISGLTGDEIKKVIQVIREGRPREEARACLTRRHTNTVNRAYNVLSEFHRRGLASLDDEVAANIATCAKYGATAAYVQRLFLTWRAEQTNLPLAHQESDRLEGNSGPPASDSLRSTLKQLAGTITFDPPHQWIGFKLDPDRWARRARSPHLRDSAQYRQVMTHHLEAAREAETERRSKLAQHQEALIDVGVWECLTRWYEGSRLYRAALGDWYATITVLVEMVFEAKIDESIRDALSQQGVDISARPPFTLKEPSADIPQDSKTATWFTAVADAVEASIMCELLMQAACAHDPLAWSGEVLELEKLRKLAVESLLHFKEVGLLDAQRRVVDDIWEWPENSWQVRRKTEALAATYQVIAEATNELSQKLDALIDG